MKQRSHTFLGIVLITCLIALTVLLFHPASSIKAAEPSSPNHDDLGLPSIPASDSPSSLQTELGRQLFFDTRLSGNGSISCGSCHQPSKAFADGKQVAEGIYGKKGTRNTPSILNSRFLTSFFWDGRRPTLADQAKDPFVNPAEHGLASHADLVNLVRDDAGYQEAFSTIFGTPTQTITLEQISQTIATYVGSLTAGDAPFDRYYYAGDRTALSSQAVQGLQLFQGAAHCGSCHVIEQHWALFTDGRFHRLGVGTKRIESQLADLASAALTLSTPELDHRVLNNPELAELGRFLVTHAPKDIGKFKTPSLRNVAITAPYMHDGSIATLEEAVDREIYYRSLESGRALLLSPSEKIAIVEFLKSLTSTGLSQ